MSEQTNNEDTNSTPKVYLTIMADGKFHQKVEEGTPGAVLREGDTKDGTHYSKLELITDGIEGKITRVNTYDGEYGKNLVLTMNVGGEEVNVSTGTAQNFGEDLLHKILNVNLNVPVSLVPYVEEKNGKLRKGVHVAQNGQEIWSYFQKWDKDLGKFVPLNGMPVAPVAKAGKKISSDEWKMYFMSARMFMIDAVEAAFGVTDNTTGKF